MFIFVYSKTIIILFHTNKWKKYIVTILSEHNKTFKSIFNNKIHKMFDFTIKILRI